MAVAVSSVAAGMGPVRTGEASAGPPAAPVLVAAGDIACAPGNTPAGAPGDPRLTRRCQQARTAALAARLAPDAVAVLGDAENDRGTLAEFEGSFAPTWGTFGRLLRPAVGNHEYTVPGASGYFAYFGPAAGPRGRGYYSYDVGRWHVVVLNSNCGQVSCRRGSRQERWLRSDLAAHSARCTLAYWHHPRFSSGYHGNDGAVATWLGATSRRRAPTSCSTGTITSTSRWLVRTARAGATRVAASASSSWEPVG